MLFLLLLIKKQYIFQNYLYKKKYQNSDKWIVITVFNRPNSFFIKFLKCLHSWKVVIVGNSIENDRKWRPLNNKNYCVYLSLKEQNKLNYKITKFLKSNSYYRKNIGYLFAIQHGAKEIYEIDEDIIISDSNNLNFNYNNTMIGYGMRNDSKMINPYDFFSENTLWPRGFIISDIGENEDNKFYILNSTKIKIKPIIFQGLINGNSDVDSIFFQTRIHKKKDMNFKFNNHCPLLYIPGNYVPINSKNTKYLYEIFPLLLLPTTLNERLTDIFRGYIMQRFAWLYNGAIIYHNNNIYKEFQQFNSSQFIKEKSLYYNLSLFLAELDNNLKTVKYNTTELLINLIKNLIKKRFLLRKDLKIYKLFIQDLNNIGYNFHMLKKNNLKINKNTFKISKFKIYHPQSLNIILINKNFQILRHYISYQIFADVLLIINYNHFGFQNLNNYLLKLYKEHFPNIVFIYPNNIKRNNIISCNESFYGYFSYICLKKVYTKFPNFKGYLFINDDDYMKIWELDNLDFKIPWLYNFEIIRKEWFHFKECIDLPIILNKNIEYKNNLNKFLGFYDIPIAIADFYYIPNSFIKKFCIILQEMYNHRIFLECSIPTTMAIIDSPQYQIIYFKPLWEDERKKAIHYLKKDFKQITIHAIKFSNFTFQKEVLFYNYFINAKEY